jgi:hypothetical protein
MSEINKLKFYADAECTQEIKTISWSNSTKIKLIDGTEKIVSNSVLGGREAIATVWLRNESQSDFGITGVFFPDNRVKINFSSAWVYPQRPIQMTLIFSVPQNPTKDDMIKDGQINIQGYFIVKS